MVDRLKKFDYLALEITPRKKIVNSSTTYLCFSELSFEHCVHSSDPHLNTISDLLFLLIKQNQSLSLQVANTSSATTTKQFREISEKLEYLRASRESTLKQIAQLADSVSQFTLKLTKLEETLKKIEEQLL